MTAYPILVKRLAPATALRIVCERCGAEEDIGPDDILNEGLYNCPRGIASCGGIAVMKYMEGDECKNCGKLDWEMPLDGCCSRRCQLQYEHAKRIGAA